MHGYDTTRRNETIPSMSAPKNRKYTIMVYALRVLLMLDFFHYVRQDCDDFVNVTALLVNYCHTHVATKRKQSGWWIDKKMKETHPIRKYLSIRIA